MPHNLILGMTESGKTTLAQQIAQKQINNGISVIVLAPWRDPSWQTPHIYTNPDEFLAVVREARNCDVFIDEAGDMVGRYAGEMRALATRFRHLGHNCYFITQRAGQLDKTVRDQCSNLFLFSVSFDDSKILANEYAREELKRACDLKQGEFFRVKRHHPVVKMRVF